MLLLIIPTVWLVIAMLTLAACRAAARADTTSANAGRPTTPGRRGETVGQQALEPPTLELPGLRVWGDVDVDAVARHAAALAGPRITSARRLAAASPRRSAEPHERRAPARERSHAAR